MTSFTIAFILSMFVAAVLTPLVLKVALKRGLYDVPDERKVHSRPIPRLGGIAIVLGFFAPVTGLLLIDTAAGEFLTRVESRVIGLYIGGFLIVGLGIFDDLKGAKAWQKLIVQVSVGLLMYSLGYRIEAVSNPFGAGGFELGWLALPVTLAWFIGVINAVNLIDGLDGLAGGVGFISVSTLFIVALMDGNVLAALFCASLAGSLMGFLFFNFNPARIFMGDTGSLFLGFVLAAFSISTSWKSSATIALVVPLLALGLPIFDTFLAIGRRVRTGRPIMSADRDHIHHKLLRAGFSHRQAVLFLYVVALMLGGAAVLMRATQDLASGLVLLVVGLILFVFFRLVVARNPNISGVMDPFEGSPLDRPKVWTMCREIAGADSTTVAGRILDDLAAATGVLAVSVMRGQSRGDNQVLYAWSRPFEPSEVIRGMTQHGIDLNGQEGDDNVMIHLQFAHSDADADLSSLLPWELIAPCLAKSLAVHDWQPLKDEMPVSSASLKPFLTIPGIRYAEMAADS